MDKIWKRGRISSRRAWGSIPIPPIPPPKKKKKKENLEKKFKKSETAINTCVSLINQHWKKMAEILQEHDFLFWSTQNFVRKIKQFIRKYNIA